jgi:soluble P-type ATPase
VPGHTVAVKTGTTNDSHKGTIETALFITNLHTDTDNSLHIVKSLEAKNRVIMWVTNGVSTSLAMKVAAISLVVGRLSRPDVTLAADLFASRFNSSILTRILYNKK